MKTIRLNDKMWFGKYKNHRMIDILKSDRFYLDSLREQKLIDYDKSILEFISSASDFDFFVVKKTMNVGRIERPPRNINYIDDQWWGVDVTADQNNVNEPLSEA